MQGEGPMTEPEPLKGKVWVSTTKGCMFPVDDVRSAVEWLKEKTKDIDTHGFIDEAFEDVIKK